MTNNLAVSSQRADLICLSSLPHIKPANGAAHAWCVASGAPVNATASASLGNLDNINNGYSEELN
jgi:hypothetical protein